MEKKSNGIIDNNEMYFYKLFLDDDLTILFGWFRQKRRVGLFIIKNFQEDNETTIYDSQEDEFLEKGKHRKSPPPVVIRYLEDTIVEILGEEYKPPIAMGYDIYSMILNEMMAFAHFICTPRNRKAQGRTLPGCDNTGQDRMGLD